MKTLLLARHGTAEERRGGENDFIRRLTSAGRKESAFAGKRLRKRNLIPGAVISSPAPRAYETAKIISGKIKIPKEKIRTEKILYSGNVSQVLDILKKIKGNEKVIMLCGHNPLLEEIFASLCGGQVKEIHKGDVASIALNIIDWKNVKANTGTFSFMIKQIKNTNLQDMKTNKSKNQKKELQTQIANLLNSLVKSKTKTDSKKIRKSVKEASKLVAKAILKSQTAEVKVKANKNVAKKKPVKKVKGIKAKPVVKKKQVRKPVQPKPAAQKLRPAGNNTQEKMPVVATNPLEVQ